MPSLTEPMNWLILSYYANQKGACQAEWLDDRVRGLQAVGQKARVIASLCAALDAPYALTRVPSMSWTDARFEKVNRGSPERTAPVTVAVALILRIIGIIPDVVIRLVTGGIGEGRWGWMMSAFLAGAYQMATSRYDVVFSTGGPASAHVTAILLGKLFRKKIICELQDPLTGDDIGRNTSSRTFLSLVEALVVKQADLCIYVTGAAAAKARQKYQAGNVVHIYPGAWPVAQAVPKRAGGGPAALVHLGSLYQSRNFDTLLDAVDPLGPGVVTIENIGHVSPEIAARLRQRPDLVRMSALVPRERALERAQHADFLLLIQNNDDRSGVTIPFKTYDYLQLGVPVIGLLRNNPELAELLERHGHLTADVSDVAAVRDCVARALRRDHTISVPADLTPVHAAERMVALVSGVR
jgi:hypothetical protein